MTDKTTEAGACAVCDEPLERDAVFISTLDGHLFCSLPCRNEFWELSREERMKDV